MEYKHTEENCPHNEVVKTIAIVDSKVHNLVDWKDELHPMVVGVDGESFGLCVGCGLKQWTMKEQKYDKRRERKIKWWLDQYESH